MWGGFSPKGVLESYCFYDCEMKYIGGSIVPDSSIKIVSDIITKDFNEIPYAYESASGYLQYAKTASSGIAITWSSIWDISVIDPISAPYTDTPLGIYLITRPLSLFVR